MDGAYFDDDGMIDGSVRIRYFAANFSLLDFDYNGFVDAGDRAIISPMACLGDFNCDGAVNSQDFFDFLNAFFALSPSADINRDHVINSQDFFDFLVPFVAGC
jgi:hypothetical protein